MLHSEYEKATEAERLEWVRTHVLSVDLIGGELMMEVIMPVRACFVSRKVASLESPPDVYVRTDPYLGFVLTPQRLLAVAGDKLSPAARQYCRERTDVSVAAQAVLKVLFAEEGDGDVILRDKESEWKGTTSDPRWKWRNEAPGRLQAALSLINHWGEEMVSYLLAPEQK